MDRALVEPHLREFSWRRRAAGLRFERSVLRASYVFSGGALCAASERLESARRAGLEVVDFEALRAHYARTLRLWHGRLDREREQVCRPVGEKRYRIWRIYMAGAPTPLTVDGFRLARRCWSSLDPTVP